MRCSVYIAMSLDGFIARRDGSIDWLSIVERAGEDYGYKHFHDSIDTIVVGRNTYEQVLGFGAWLQSAVGHDAFAARAASGPQHWLGAILSSALTFAAVGTNVGHELTHRTGDRAAMLAGRWLLALTFDAEFAIEHVYGHHRRLATPADPAGPSHTVRKARTSR